MLWSRNDVLLRALEVALGAAVATALWVALTSGWLVTGAQTFSDWYASRVDGVLDITVVSTTVTLPQVGRADLPLPERDSLAFLVTDDAPGVTSSAEPDASPPAAEQASSTE